MVHILKINGHENVFSRPIDSPEKFADGVVNDFVFASDELLSQLDGFYENS